MWQAEQGRGAKPQRRPALLLQPHAGILILVPPWGALQLRLLHGLLLAMASQASASMQARPSRHIPTNQQAMRLAQMDLPLQARLLPLVAPWLHRVWSLTSP